MTILVTGAAGFIGRALCETLLSHGQEVVGTDNLNDYYSIDLKEQRLATLSQYQRFRFQQFDLTDMASVELLFSNSNFSHVYHLAAQAGVRLKPNHLDRYISSNISAFTNVINSAIARSVPNFLYASSSSVYGDSETNLLSESSTSNIPTSYYGATKLFNEHAARVLSHESNTKTRGLRFFTVYGPMGRPDMAYFRIATSLLTSTEFQLHGDGNIRRDFTYIDDVVTSCILLGEQLNEISNAHSDVVNVGGGRPQTMRELIETTEKLTGTRLQILNTPAVSSDVKQTEADTKLIQKLTGFTPKIQIESGMANFLDWAKQEDVVGKLTSWVESSK
jgi:UDP-glucuronate 4-epimerase